MSLFFKFKSAKDFDRLDCDGSNMSAFDVKVAIASKHKLEKDPNFDLQLVNAQVRKGHGAQKRKEKKKEETFVLTRLSSRRKSMARAAWCLLARRSS